MQMFERLLTLMSCVLVTNWIEVSGDIDVTSPVEAVTSRL